MPKQRASTETAIRHPRSYSANIARINTLPLEILTDIFHLVFARPCEFLQSTDPDESVLVYPRFPEYLAQVCTLWRKIILSSPWLWRHLDLARDDKWYSALCDRLEKHLDLSDQSPLELHVAEDDNTPSASILQEYEGNYEGVEVVLSQVSYRVETLEMVVTRAFGPFHRRVLRGLFNRAGRYGDPVPALSKLVLWSRGFHYNAFIHPVEFERHEVDDECDDLAINLTEGDIEEGLSSITVLHARGIFPQWSSVAYHGLVDLRLLSADCWSNIEEAEIISILKSSPGLRILHFGLAIKNQIPDAGVTPVELPDLQVVKVFPSSNPDSCNILRLLAPGTKHLRLSLEDCEEQSANLMTQLDKFFARSNVVKFHTKEIFPPFRLLLRYAAQLECVMLSNFDPQSNHELRADLLHTDEQAAQAHLKSLRLLNAFLSESDLNSLVEFCPSGIILDNSVVYRYGSDGSKYSKLSGKKFSKAFPEVKITSQLLKHATADWDTLD